MSIFSSKLGLALVLATLCLGERTAHAQTAPVAYLIPGWSVGFGSNPADGQSSSVAANFQGLEGSDTGGSSYKRYNFPNGLFVGSESGGMGLNMNGFNQAGAFGNIGAPYYEGMQFGYNFKGAGGLPVTLYAGFDTLKYNPGVGGPFSSFDSMSNTPSGYNAHAGVEFKPTSNLSLSLGVGYTQQSGLPGVSPFAPGGYH